MGEKKLNIGSVLPTKLIVSEIKPVEQKRESGIILPNPVRKNPQTMGKVLLTGTGTENQPMMIKEGQIVVYTPLSGQRFILDEEELVLLDQANILFFYSDIS